MKTHILAFIVSASLSITTYAHGGGGHCGGGHGGGHGSHGGGHATYCAMGHGWGNIIDYLPHFGVAELDGGGCIQGLFRHAWFGFPADNFKFYGNDSVMPQRLYWQFVSKMTLAGADSLISYRKDSTEFYHLNHCYGFYRKLTNGKIKVYDGLASVNEVPGAISGNDMVVIYKGKLFKFHTYNGLNQFIADIIPSYTQTIKAQGNNVNTVSLFAAINKYNRGKL